MSARLNISYPYAAMHIRHGDKLIWEAKYINEKRFIERANDFLDKLSSNVTDRKIYVGSETIRKKNLENIQLHGKIF